MTNPALSLTNSSLGAETFTMLLFGGRGRVRLPPSLGGSNRGEGAHAAYYPSLLRPSPLLSFSPLSLCAFNFIHSLIPPSSSSFRPSPSASITLLLLLPPASSPVPLHSRSTPASLFGPITIFHEYFSTEL